MDDEQRCEQVSRNKGKTQTPLLKAFFTDSTSNHSINSSSAEQNYNIVSHLMSTLAPWKVSRWQSWASKSESLTNWPPLSIPDWSVSVRQPLAAANIISFFCPHFDKLLAERRRFLILCSFLSREFLFEGVIDCFHFGAILNSVMLLVGFYDFAPSIS